MICPYCGGEIPSKDFAMKTPEGKYFCFPCGDKALDEWVKLKEIERIVVAAYCADQILVSQGGYVGDLARLIMDRLEGRA